LFLPNRLSLFEIVFCCSGLVPPDKVRVFGRGALDNQISGGALQTMHRQNTKSVTRLHQNRKLSKTPKRPAADRRSGNDRRKIYSAAYFLNGGVERRSWKERRFFWYMTD
jgi:hypothetical protein